MKGDKAVPATKHVRMPGKLVMVGFGSVGQGVLPLLLRHLKIPRSQVIVITAHERGAREAARYGVTFMVNALTRGNIRAVLEPILKPGDFLLNVSVDVSSVNLIQLCQAKGAMYLDTCIEPWAGGYTDRRLSPSQRSNYALREAALALNKKHQHGPTAVLTHGVQPGGGDFTRTHLVKEVAQALQDVPGDKKEHGQKDQGGSLLPDGLPHGAGGSQYAVVKFQGVSLGGRKETQTQVNIDIE